MWLWLVAGLIPALILVGLFYVWANASGLLGSEERWTPPTPPGTVVAGGVITATPGVSVGGEVTAAATAAFTAEPFEQAPTASPPEPSPAATEAPPPTLTALPANPTPLPLWPTEPPADPTPLPPSPTEPPADPTATPAAGAGGAAPPGTPAPGAQGTRRIAFVSDRTGLPQVWVVDVASGEQRALTTTGRNENPAWSPDNLYLYYTSERDGAVRFYRYEFATGREEMLSDVTAGGQLAQAPDGRLAYVRHDGDRYRLTVGGRDLFTLDRPFSFAWSPDGNLLLMDALAPPRAIYVLDLRDGGSRQAADNGWNATWGPGRSLLYASDRQGVAFLYVADTDGSDARVVGPTDKWSQAPAWSPDGEWIVYVASDGPAWNLYLMTGEGAETRLFAPLVNPNRSAQWEPGGTRAVYESNRSGNWDIYIRGVEGPERQLTGDPANDWAPVWSW